jgi:hypothetical protein
LSGVDHIPIGGVSFLVSGRRGATISSGVGRSIGRRRGISIWRGWWWWGLVARRRRRRLRWSIAAHIGILGLRLMKFHLLLLSNGLRFCILLPNDEKEVISKDFCASHLTFFRSTADTIKRRR